MDTKLLEEIGLTKGEIRVYLTLLKLGETTTGKIIEKAQISGGKVYIILDKLIKKGLASYIIKEKTKHFSPSNPNKIIEYINIKEKSLESKKKKIQDQLSTLLVTTPSKQYDTQLYLGYEGIKTAIFEALNKISLKDEVLVMGVELAREDKYNIMWKHWHSKRIKKGINCKMLFSNKEHKYHKIISKMKKTQIRILKGITPSSVGIVGDHILITTYGDNPSCLLIKHPEIVSSFKTFFETLWGIAKL